MAFNSSCAIYLHMYSDGKHGRYVPFAYTAFHLQSQLINRCLLLKILIPSSLLKKQTLIVMCLFFPFMLGKKVQPIIQNHKYSPMTHILKCDHCL